MANNKKKKPTTIKRKGSAKFIQLNKEFIAPITKVEQNYDFIRYGKNNDYPNFLTELLSSSGLHRAIIEKKVSLTVGNGINIEDVSPETLKFILNPNPFEDLNSILQKCSYDLETYGGYYLQVIWNPNNKTVDSIYHMDFERMRVGLPNEYGFTDTIYYYDDLSMEINQFADISQTTPFPVFSENADKSEPQIYQVKKYTPTNKYYGSPIYEAGVLDIQTYAEVANFHNSNLHNNFAPGFLIFFTGTPPSDELQDDIVKELQTQYAGTDNVGGPLLFFLEEDMEKPEIKPMEVSDLDKQFDQLIKQVIDNIAVSHQIPRQVVGLETAGSLGSSKEMLEATQIFKTSYIEPQQQVLLGSFNVLMAINGLDELKIVNPNPSIMMYEIKDLSLILTQNELREYLGYEELEEETIVNEQEKNNDKIDE